MKEELGTKGGKKDLKLSFLSRKRKLKLNNEELSLKKQKEAEEKQIKKDQEIILNLEKQKEAEEKQTKKVEEIVLGSEKQNTTEVPIKDEIKLEQSPLLDKVVVEEKIEIIESLEPPVETEVKEVSFIDYPRIKAKGKNKEVAEFPTTYETQTDDIKEDKTPDSIDFIEKQIIQVIERDIEEKRFQLKKIDSQIHTIQKSIDTATNEDQLDDIEKEIERLMAMLEQIKKQILSLEKTFDFKFPVEEPDNYLIYLIEEYKDYRKEEKDFYKRLQDKKEYISLIDTLIEVESKQEGILEKVQEKKEQFDLEEGQIEKLNDDIIDIEEINKKVTKMLDEHKNLLEQIEHKVNETVNITERVEFITRSVEHTMLELFLLMGVLKHNLSIKNNAIAAAIAAVALDAIIKMTTPIKEKVVVKDCDIKDYENMIKNCISDTNFLDQMIHNNLNQISSIRYTFEKDYNSYFYLPSYQEAIEKLTKLEDDMIQRKKDVARIKKDMELQLEKNNAKVKKYGSMKAA